MAGEDGAGLPVVVVGAGICGLATAYFLAQRGHRVVVLEREEVGGEFQASAVNSGFLHADPLPPPLPRAGTTPEERAQHDRAVWTAVSGLGSLGIYAGLAERCAQHDIALDLEFRALPMVQVAATLAHHRAAMAAHPVCTTGVGLGRGTAAGAPASASVSAHGQSPCYLLGPDLRALFPAIAEGVHGALFWPRAMAASVHPAKATRGLLRVIQLDLGDRVQVLEGHEVTRITQQQLAPSSSSSRDGGEPVARWEVTARRLRERTDSEGDGGPPLRIEAGAVVLAAGGWTRYFGSMLGVALPVVPVFGQMWSTPPQPGRIMDALLCSMESTQDWAAPGGSSRDRWNPPAVTHQGRWHEGGRWGPRLTRHLYGKQTPEGRLIFGGDRRVHPPQRPGLAHPLPRLRPDGVAANRAHVAEVLPCVAGLPVERTWAGIMPFSIDGVPLVGRVDAGPAAPASGLFVISGMGGSGMTRGLMGGKLLADLISTGTTGGGRAPAHPALRATDPRRFATAAWARDWVDPEDADVPV